MVEYHKKVDVNTIYVFDHCHTFMLCGPRYSYEELKTNNNLDKVRLRGHVKLPLCRLSLQTWTKMVQ